jgi:hypothetical protein
LRKETLLEGTAMSVVVELSARETFTARELAAAYKELISERVEDLELVRP